MAYNKKNWLKRAIEIQAIWRENHKHWNGSSDGRWIHRNIVEPRFHISKSAMYEYLGCANPEKQLHKLQATEKQQLEMF